MAAPVLRLGLIGHGTVGQSFAHHLADATIRIERRTGVRVQLSRIAVRRPDRVRLVHPRVRVCDDPLDLALDPALDLVVEASGAREASDWLLAALNRGATIVTANKQAVANSYALLQALADRHPGCLAEGAVAAAIPIVRTLRDSLQGEDIRAIRGILNGTSTFVLSAVERGASWDTAVADAVAAGLAEPNSTADFDGSDAAAKLAILATIAWRTPIHRDRVRVRGLDARAETTAQSAFASGRRLRVVADAWTHGGGHLLVEPRVLEADDPLLHVSGATNAIELDAALAGQLRWFGPGAGGAHTASALLADVAHAAAERSRRARTQVAA
ncbi:MAG: homoserine dehydrogenase [Gemmatimonadetes bacterium]|nr:homoserine dehydrogenase [Gemmatimonadota bacterium]